MTCTSTIFNVVGARPNMMKMAPIMAEMRRHSDLHPILVHTGQHYDFAMSQVFLEQLKLGMPDFNLQVGSGTDHDQVSEIVKRFGELVAVERPDMIVVAGDVNSTMACAVLGAKASIPVAHIEAGLRSFDRTMPEEVNRIIADSVSELLFTTEPAGAENLLREGVPGERIHFVGNVMIDSLVYALEAAQRSSMQARLGLRSGSYALLTLHRPSNVDNAEHLYATLEAIAEISGSLPVIFPMHPRTSSTMSKMQIPEIRVWDGSSPLGRSGIWTMPPASYVDFVSLMQSSAMVITDSGGIQEETTYLKIPCLTFRNNTERPITVTQGTNCLVGQNPKKLLQEASRVLAERDRLRGGKPPELWDGHAAERIVRVIRSYLKR